MSDERPDRGALSPEEKTALVGDLRRQLASAQSEIRLLKRRLERQRPVGQASGEATEGTLRERLRQAAPQRRLAAPPQVSMTLGRRLGLWSSPILMGFVAVVFVALALDAGVGWYQSRSLKAERQARLQLENVALRSLYVELKRVVYEADGKSYRMTVAIQNNNPAVPLYVMLNPVGVYVQVGMTWQQVPSKPGDGVSWGVVKVVDDFSYDVLFTPQAANWAELIPGYMHLRIQDDMLVSQSAQPGNDVVERRTPFYIYLKPQGASDDDIKARSRMSGVPPVFIPMPPH
jgi:hypothetical protein